MSSPREAGPYNLWRRQLDLNIGTIHAPDPRTYEEEMRPYLANESTLKSTVYEYCLKHALPLLPGPQDVYGNVFIGHIQDVSSWDFSSAVMTATLKAIPRNGYFIDYAPPGQPIEWEIVSVRRRMYSTQISRFTLWSPNLKKEEQMIERDFWELPDVEDGSAARTRGAKSWCAPVFSFEDVLRIFDNHSLVSNKSLPPEVPLPLEQHLVIPEDTKDIWLVTKKSGEKLNGYLGRDKKGRLYYSEARFGNKSIKMDEYYQSRRVAYIRMTPKRREIKVISKASGKRSWLGVWLHAVTSSSTPEGNSPKKWGKEIKSHLKGLGFIKKDPKSKLLVEFVWELFCLFVC